MMALENDNHLKLQASFGLDETARNTWARVAMHKNIPATESLREDRIVWLANPSETLEMYSDLKKFPVDPNLKTKIIVPLNIANNPSGVLGFNCSEVITPTDTEISFVTAITSLVALTLTTSLGQLNGSANGNRLLSRRQKQVLALMSEGLTNAEIAEELGFSQSTIRHESMRIYKTLQVSSRKSAVEKFLQTSNN